MIPLASLWLPILISAILVFVASSLIHMVLGYHAADWKKIPSEDAVQDALRRANIPPGDYMVPCATTRAEMRSAEFIAKRDKGPVLVMTMWPAGPQGMGKSLVLWFLYTIIVSVFSGYVAGVALGPATPYLAVFRLAGTVAFAGYALGLMQDSIWYHRRWATTFRSMADGLAYALLTAGTFGWLWPR
jgi:hypothetical protein